MTTKTICVILSCMFVYGLYQAAIQKSQKDTSQTSNSVVKKQAGKFSVHLPITWRLQSRTNEYATWASADNTTTVTVSNIPVFEQAIKDAVNQGLASFLSSHPRSKMITAPFRSIPDPLLYRPSTKTQYAETWTCELLSITDSKTTSNTNQRIRIQQRWSRTAFNDTWTVITIATTADNWTTETTIPERLK